MKADFSRYEFDPRKRHSAVLHQQGRVITDADLNEEHAIQEYRSETTSADVIGPTGVPSASPGFAIDIDASSTVQISAGRMYVDGVLFENDAALPYTNQVHWRAHASPSSASDVRQLLSSAGTPLGLVYLEGFRRTVTAVDDDSIRDVALGGPDTTARSQVVWKVAVQPIALSSNQITLGAADVTALSTRIDELRQAETNLAAATGAAQRRALRRQVMERRRALRTATEAARVSCDRAYAEWIRLTAASTGQVRVTTNPVATTTGPCDVPPGSGYFSGENQLYRIEVHAVGASASNTDSTFKFSRENASVVASIEATGTTTTGTVTASEVKVGSTGRDVDLGFSDGNWVEYVDDALELAGLSGPLVKVRRVRRDSNLIELETPIQIRFGLHPKLRRWDQAGSAATSSGVAMGTAPVSLERNLLATFSGGSYRPGDWWAIPARGGAPDTHLPQVFQRAAGVRRHYARLGIVLLDSTNRLRLLFDCRPKLPALTALDATNIGYSATCDRLADAGTVEEALDMLCATQGSKCTAVAIPGTGWERVFDLVQGGADAEICFPVGVYPAPRAGVVVQGKGHLTLSGSGRGTRIENQQGECAIEFRACAGVTLRDLSVRAHSTGVASLQGAVTCVDCRQVTVESVTLESGDASQRHAACLTVRNRIPFDQRNVAPVLRVRGCTILAGEQQYGILAVNVMRAHIEDNVIICPRPNRNRSISELLRDRFVTDEVNRLVASGMRVLKQGEAPRSGEVRFDFAGQAYAFTTDPILRIPWAGFLQANQPPAGSRPNDVVQHVTSLARRLATTQVMWAQFPAVRDIVRRFENLPVSGYRGVCLAGSRLQEARIVDNTIKFFRHAVHIGLSHEGQARGQPDIADSITISGNRIEARLMPGDELQQGGNRPRAPHAVFTGNANNLVIEHNHATLVDASSNARAQVGVLVHGRLGPRILVRHNRIDGFRQAVRIVHVHVLTTPRMWMVADNVCYRCQIVAVGQLNPPLTHVMNIRAP